MSAKNSVSARTQRLNKLLVSRIDDSNVGGNKTNALINRETLLDAFDALYNECNTDSLRKHNSNVSDFTKKCKYHTFNGLSRYSYNENFYFTFSSRSIG